MGLRVDLWLLHYGGKSRNTSARIPYEGHATNFRFKWCLFCQIRWVGSRLHNEELHSLYRSLDLVRVIKSRRLRWVGHVARMEEDRSAFKSLTGKPIGKRPPGKLGINRNMLLE